VRRPRAAGGAALRRGRQRAGDRGVPARRGLPGQLPAPAGRAPARGGGALPCADHRRGRRRAPPHRGTGARPDRGRDAVAAVALNRAVPSAYRAPRWLRNPHLQSVLGSSPPRRRMAARVLAATGAVTTTHVVDGGDGVRLQGLHSVVPGRAPLGLALLLHGWEGSAESTYMRLSAARL